MFTSEGNINTLLEILTETAIVSQELTQDVSFKSAFINHINNFDKTNNTMSLVDKNQNFIKEFITFANTNNNNNNKPQQDYTNETIFEKRLKSRQAEFSKMINPDKPPSINLSDKNESKNDKPDKDINKLLEEYQSKRDTIIFPKNTNNNNVTSNFINKLKIENEQSEIPINTIDITKKVSFQNPPNDSAIIKENILSELRDIKRRINILISNLENNEDSM